MTRTILLATTALLLAPGLALAQTTESAAQAPAPTGPTQSAPLVDRAQQGVLVFTPDFFADQQPNTALDMVNRVPGFELNDGDGSRGFEGSVGNVLINGARPASKTDTGSSVLNRTLPAQVERIELIRGGAPGIAMQGYSVVVNVVLKKERTHQSIVTWNANIFEGARDLFGGTYQYSMTDGDRSWGVTLSDGISMSDSGGLGRWVRRDANGAVLRDEPFESNFGGGGQSVRANYAGPMAGGKIEATGRLGRNDWAQSQLLTSATSRRETLGQSTGESGEAGLTYTRPLSPTWSFEGRAIHNFNSTDGDSIANRTIGGVDDPREVFAYSSSSSESILRGLVRNERSASLTFEAGAEVAYNMLDTDQSYTVGGTNIPLPSASVKVEETRGEVFGKGTWRASPTLTLEGGLRLENSTISQSGDADAEKTLFFAKPRFLATWTPMENNQLRLRFEREVGQLNFDDFAASADLQGGSVFGGNVDLEPEQRWVTELEYERRFWGEGVATLTLRHDEVQDVLDYLPLAGGLSAVGNIGDGTQDVAKVAVTLPLSRLGVSGGRLSVTGTWQDSSVIDPTTGEERQISDVRPFDAEVGFTQDITHLKLQWGFNWLRGFDEHTYDPDQTTDVRLRNYRVVFVEYKPRKDLSLRAQVNIWDDFEITRTVYTDRTSPRPVAFVEQRDIDPRTFWQLRLRKTF